MDIRFAKPSIPAKGPIAVLIEEGGGLPPRADGLDSAVQGALKRAIKAAGFKGKLGQTLDVLAPSGIANDRIVVLGIGKPADLDVPAARRIGGGLTMSLEAGTAQSCGVLVELPAKTAISEDVFAANLALGARLRGYRFDKYQTKRGKDDKPKLRTLTIHAQPNLAARRHYDGLEAVAEGVLFTRDLVSEPGNVLYPAEFAKRCRALAKLGIGVEVLGRKEMERLGMGALLGVAQGSAREPQLVILRWQGAEAGAGKPTQSAPRTKARSRARPVAFVGKGITFDTGGISLKPGPGMHEMKWDMGGAAAVAGLMRTLALRKAKADVVGVLALVENMPDGKAQRPGDVVTSMSGQTIEILNTDAEGRLVLADAVWYTQNRFKPRALVDLATLTGAMIVTLGHEMAGVFATDDGLADALLAAGKVEGELLWRFPLSDTYDKKINSMIADVANMGPAGKAGSIMGAQFIKRFTNNVPWAHLDIAGMVWSNEGGPLWPKGGTGFGVALLNRLVADVYENK